MHELASILTVIEYSCFFVGRIAELTIFLIITNTFRIAIYVLDAFGGIFSHQR